MALSRDDHIEIFRLLQSNLREADPEAFEAVSRSLELVRDPRQTLLVYLELVMKVMAERSGGENGRILDLANRYIRTEDGGPVRALRIELSPREQELHEIESLDLASLPDRGAFIEELQGLYNRIREDDGYRGENF